MSDDTTLMSIGAIARATGVPTNTLRTWERRYGFPASERTVSGHRRYSLNTLNRLRLVVEVLEQGHRPSTVLAADEATLQQLLAKAQPVAAAPAPQAPTHLPQPGVRVAVEPRGDARVIEDWLGHVARYEGRALEREMGSSWAELGALGFLERHVGPFLTALGERWASGAIGVSHEHFASERMREFLSQHWRRLSDAATGPTMVLATLTGERHVLGLHMAAIVLAVSNVRVVLLGGDSPPAEVVDAAKHHSAYAVVVSASAAADGRQLAADLESLRSALPVDTAVVAGGRGLVSVPDGVSAVTSFSALHDWLEGGGPAHAPRI